MGRESKMSFLSLELYFPNFLSRSQCFCGNSYGTYGLSTQCNMTCSGNKNEICGGIWANAIYATRLECKCLIKN